MDILFLHQNFPGQFAHLAPALARAGHRVWALGARPDRAGTWNGVQVLSYRYEPPQSGDTHPWARSLNAAVDRGATVLRAATALKRRGVVPDVIVAHSGWGEALYLREVWPEARIGVFSEFFYRAHGADVGFDPEFASDEIGVTSRLRMKNLALRLQLEEADAGLTPTAWQAELHPPALRDTLSVIFDGIDTAAIAPDPAARLTLPGGPTLARGDEVVTFVNRNLEPYRGFHTFMRALPALLAARPAARVVVVGEEGVSYGRAPEAGGTWREALWREIAPHLPQGAADRIHFTGRLGRDDLTRLLQIATVHVYLTYPFVLSWSLVEAMSAGCAIAASDTAPVREAIAEGETGRLFDFFDPAALADRVAELCADPEQRARLGAAARDRAVRDYDLASVCLPRQRRWIENLARG